VKVGVCLAPACEGKSYLRFDVVDTGIGMSAHEMQQLFQPFSQADVSTTPRFGGTGLGLAISQRLAMMLGGDISVSSVAGAGSTFTITIAVEDLDQDVRPFDNDGDASHEKSSPTNAKVATLSGRILLAEDGPDNQRLIAFLLRKAGCTVAVADNGQKAVESILAAEKTAEPFDVVLMDIQMPIMDGYEATAYLRQNGYTKPVIALTAHAMQEDRERCLGAGCDGYASKPIDPRKLIASVAEWLAKSKRTAKEIETGA